MDWKLEKLSKGDRVFHTVRKQWYIVHKQHEDYPDKVWGYIEGDDREDWIELCGYYLRFTECA